jgi:hypothetical protein
MALTSGNFGQTWGTLSFGDSGRTKGAGYRPVTPLGFAFAGADESVRPYTNSFSPACLSG